jgi:hypothetical protein
VKVVKEMESDFAELTLRDRKTDDVRGYRGTWATFLGYSGISKAVEGGNTVDYFFNLWIRTEHVQ